MANTTKKGAASAAGGGALSVEVLERRPDLSRRVLTPTMIRRSISYQQQLENPDEVLKQFGTWEGLAFYFRMMRQFAFLGGPVNQRIDPVVAIKRQIVAGDPDNATSVQMMRDARRWWADVKHKEIILRKALLGQFVGFGPTEKVFGWHESSKLIAPVQLFDVPAQNVRFGEDGSEFIRTETNFRGVPVEPRKLFHFRWGSVFTPYGEGEFKDVYLATWYMQQILDFGLEAIEQHGRPVPIVYIPRHYSPTEREDVKASYAAQYKFFIDVLTDESRPRVELLGSNVSAGGNAGRSENEWLRYFENWIWSRLLNTAQTQDRGGSGNGKLEEVRGSLKNDKTVQASAALDDCLTEGLLEDIGELNWSTQPRELWPRFDSDAEEVAQNGLSAGALQQVNTALLQLAAKQITETSAEELIASAGVPRSKAIAMVQSTMRERGKLVTLETAANAAPATVGGELAA